LDVLSAPVSESTKGTSWFFANTAPVNGSTLGEKTRMSPGCFVEPGAFMSAVGWQSRH
jgi:hypothetical protein